LFHAGLLWLNGETITPFVSQDNNITHVVCDHSSEELRLIENAHFFPEFAYDCDQAFQTGPLILSEGEWYDDLDWSTFDASSHQRTLLLVVDDQTWFVSVRSEITLWEIGRYIMSMPEFLGSEITLINLDGGSSVTYISDEYPQLNYGISKHLPILIGIN